MQTRSVVWIDAVGNKSITKINTSAGATIIQGNILNCSQADFLQYWEGANVPNVGPVAPGGVYLSVTQRAALVFLCADNSQVDVIIPAPSASIFLADKQTVNPANVFVAALIAACIGNLASNTGSLATTYLSGTLSPFIQPPL